jgi:hypothetical protein
MANNQSANPWYVDTVGFSWTGRVYIKELVWNKPTAGTNLVIVDQNGNTILNATANAQDPQQSFGSLGWVNGLHVTTLASGVLSIFINK